MKKILRTVGLLLICGTLCLPVAEARGGNGSNTARPSTGQQRPSGRPGNSGGRPSQNQPAQRPGNQGGNHGNRPGQNQPSQRPGNQGGNHGNRPGQNQPSQRPGNQGGNHGNRPGQNQPSQRPGNQGGNHGNRPGHNQPDYRPNQPVHRPGHPVANHRPGHPAPPPRPGYGYEHYYRPTPPSRPYLPPPRPYYRPAPPRTWRPAPTWRPFSTILGVSFGSAINVSLNLLFNSGYTVSSYCPDAIYLSNVPMLNCYWPDATMYYSNGALAGSEFVYYTPYNNAARYNTVFNALCGSYGTPVSVTTNGGLTIASWWGPGNQYISLSYGSQYAGNGSLGYFTTLTFGI